MSQDNKMIKRKINANATGFALAITLTLINIFCLLLLLIAPNFFLNLFGSFMHGLDLSKIAVTPSIGADTFIGIIVTFVGGYIIGVVFATIYNKFK